MKFCGRVNFTLKNFFAFFCSFFFCARSLLFRFLSSIRVKGSLRGKKYEREKRAAKLSHEELSENY